MNYSDKKQELLNYIDELAHKDIALAFSGGVDSSLLLKLCCEAAQRYGSTVYAVTIHTELHPMGDLEISRRVAQEAGAEHMIIKTNELEEAGIQNNPVDRCYLCKRCLFEKLLKTAEELHAPSVMEGTNEDDLHVYRPGIRALKELAILSPLAMFGLTKEDVRKMATEYGVSVANRPSMPCMATRFPYGTKLSYELMHVVERGEEVLRSAGFYNVRLRVHDNILRIELDKGSMAHFLEMYDSLASELRSLGFDYITLDMEGFRSGSMDIHVRSN